MRKCKGIGEVADGGVRMTEGRTALDVKNSAIKKRKVDGGELELSTSLVQLKTRPLNVVKPENSDSGNSTCDSVSSDHVLASCCSSNESTESSKFADLEIQQGNGSGVEVETWRYDLVDCRKSRPTSTPSSEVEAELESTARPREANAGNRSKMQNMPSETELEEFFAAAEKDLQKQFTDKYNFVIMDDKPLEGRYEWVELNP